MWENSIYHWQFSFVRLASGFRTVERRFGPERQNKIMCRSIDYRSHSFFLRCTRTSHLWNSIVRGVTKAEQLNRYLRTILEAIKLTLKVARSFLDIQSSKRAAELPSGYTVYTHLGVAYKFHRTEIEWNNARKYCASHGANLAVIDSYEKVQHVIELRGASKENIFVGMHRLFDDVEWIDVKNGEIRNLIVDKICCRSANSNNVSYCRIFEPGSPRVAIPWRHLTHENVPSRLCMKLSTYDGDHGLYAAECTAPRGFVCEVSIFRD